MTTHKGSSTALAIGMSFDIRLWFFFLTFRSRLPFPLPLFNQMSAWAYLCISFGRRKNKMWDQDNPQSCNQSFINCPIWSVIAKIPRLWNVHCSAIPINTHWVHWSNKPYRCYTKLCGRTLTHILQFHRIVVECFHTKLVGCRNSLILQTGISTILELEVNGLKFWFQRLFSLLYLLILTYHEMMLVPIRREKIRDYHIW